MRRRPCYRGLIRLTDRNFHRRQRRKEYELHADGWRADGAGANGAESVGDGGNDEVLAGARASDDRHASGDFGCGCLEGGGDWIGRRGYGLVEQSSEFV